MAVGLVKEISGSANLPKSVTLENFWKLETSRSRIGLPNQSFLKGLASFLQGQTLISLFSNY